MEYIIISSPFYSLSNHKYDTIYFNHVDPYFGYIEQTNTNKGLDIKGKVHNNNGDKELNLLIFNLGTKKNLLDENLTDTATWVWTDQAPRHTENRPTPFSLKRNQGKRGIAACNQQINHVGANNWSFGS